MLPALDSALRSGKIVLIEGHSDLGKTEVMKGWCEMLRGLVVYISLTGVANKTVFFRTLARTLGVASGSTQKTTQMQAAVEAMVVRSRLCLVIDEAHYLFSGSERSNVRPELVDWIYSALTNRGVPVILGATPLFSNRLHHAEQNCSQWNSDQFRRRITRMYQLPAKPTLRDVELVAQHHCPTIDEASLNYVAGYTRSAQHPFTTTVDVIGEARFRAEECKRATPSHADFKYVITEIRGPSDNAKFVAFDEPPAPAKKGRSKPVSERFNAPLSDVESDASAPAGANDEPPRGTVAVIGSRRGSADNFAGHRIATPLETHPANSGQSGTLMDA